MERSIRIVIIEDDETIRNGYAFLIGANEGYQVVNTYPSVDVALATLQQDDPEVLLLDIELPGTNGIEALPKIKKNTPQLLRDHAYGLRIAEADL